MKVVGLTGGIGMGKSTAAQWFQGRNYPVVDTDDLARKVVEPGEPALEEIRREFGDQMIGPDGRLRRDALARVAFSDQAARARLERITHPRIRDLWIQRTNAWREGGRPLGVVAVPLLFEIGAETSFDCTLCVACSTATQERRLADRGWTPEETKQRIAAQWPIGRKIARADFVAWTESGVQIMAEQLERILQKLAPG